MNENIPTPRKVAVTMPEHPSGYEKRITTTDPRVASDNSAYEERVYQAVAKDEGGFTGNPVDTNLYGRVKEVRNVAQTTGHLISDYPGESPWFIKSSLGSDDGAYITILCKTTGTPGSYKAVKFVANPDGEYYNSLQICYDGITWVPVVLGTEYTPTVTTGEYAGCLYVRGRINHNGGVCPKFSGNADAIEEVWGDLSFLLDYRATSAVVPKYRVFAHMFEGCTGLNYASGLILPSGKSGISAYAQMFDGCTSLEEAPDLSQVGLSNNIFYRMFAGCTSLEEAPALPAVDVLPLQAYKEMFKGCTYLSSITVHIGDHIIDDALLDWMDGAGTAVDGTCTFNHSGNFRWRYPSKSGIPGSAQAGQKEWTPVPALTTKLFFSSRAGGSIAVTAGGASVESGAVINIGTAIVVTPTAASGYVFDKWVTKPSVAVEDESTHALAFNMPYSRYDETDKIECVCQFRNNKNLSVNYRIENTTSDLAFVRCPEEDALRGGQEMFAWTPGDTTNTTLMTGIGILYTDTLTPAVGSVLHKVDAAGNWFESEGTINGEIWTDNFTVIVFDNATTYSNSIKISVAGGSTYRNSYKSFCALTAPANASITIDVYQSDGTTHVATADLHWSDENEDNPRTVTVLAANKGICLSRDAN